jgi:CCR4-NOT transcription complex subunit 1
MHAMAEWYIRGDSDQTKLSRILDVAQDLKVTSFNVLSHRCWCRVVLLSESVFFLSWQSL